MIKVQLGTPKNEGFYEIKVFMIKLRDGLPDSEIFEKLEVGSVQVDVTHSGAQIKDQMINLVE